MNKNVYILTEMVYGEDGADIESTRAFADSAAAKAALRKRYGSEVRRARRIEMLYGNDISRSGNDARIYWTDGDTTQLSISSSKVTRTGRAK